MHTDENRKPTQLTDVASNREGAVRLQKPNLPRINLRFFLYPALGLIFGIFLYCRIRFGGIRATDFVFFILLFALSVRPVSWKRYLAIFLSFLLLAGADNCAVFSKSICQAIFHKGSGQHSQPLV